MLPTPFSQDSTRVMHVAVLSVFSFLALVAVIFRLWARKIQRNKWETNDYLVIVGLIWALALSIFTMHSTVSWDLGGDATQYGSSESIDKLVVLQFKALLVGQVTWAVAVTFIRASVLALYIRIFRTKSFRMTCYVVHGINAAFGATTILGACLICQPVSFNWERSIPGGYCGDQKSLDLFIGIFNLLMDVAVVMLPMPVLWGLQMAVGKKITLSSMFGLGIIICVITLVRVDITTMNRGTNAQKIYSLIALFTTLEALLGVINACLPVLKPIVNKFGDSRASAWLSSVMSGTIPIFMRPSQMGSKWITPSATKKDSGMEKEMPEMPRWPGSHAPLPRYVDDKAANMMFPSPTTNVRSPSSSSPIRSRGPPVPPKEEDYELSPTKNWDRRKLGKGIRVQKDWDVERAMIEESDTQPLDPRRDYVSGW
ncbi:MAG: hypothetical protein ALECFALPRED_003006 [Alectoria fallacina]|uniref:Rhodopsin domain-containing protein n=1 Tax=Alectoria fallacina TaxID=1903189 RepID=A0A8H3EER1_9LECA|nr:MAG: hypothetical protein ALECFALPRED_003006 [Alectoria fallacina]